MLWFVCFFNYADRQALSGVAPKLKEEFGFSNDEMGLIGSAFMWVYAAAAPLAGFIGDRFRRKDLVLGGCLFWSFITVLTGGCGKLRQFVFVRALEGFGETFYFPASMSLVSDYHSPRTRSRAMSFHQSSVYAGTILDSISLARPAWEWPSCCILCCGNRNAGNLNWRRRAESRHPAFASYCVTFSKRRPALR